MKTFSGDICDTFIYSGSGNPCPPEYYMNKAPGYWDGAPIECCLKPAGTPGSIWGDGGGSTWFSWGSGASAVSGSISKAGGGKCKFYERPNEQANGCELNPTWIVVGVVAALVLFKM